MPKTVHTTNSRSAEERVADAVFDRAFTLVRASGLVYRLRRWREEDHWSSSPSEMSLIKDHATLTAWLIAAFEERRRTSSTLRSILFERLTLSQRLALDLDTKEGRSQGPQSILRATARLLEPLDPYPMSRRQLPTVGEAKDMVGQRDIETETRRTQRLDEFTRQLLVTSISTPIPRTTNIALINDRVVVPSRPRWDKDEGEEPGASDPDAYALTGLKGAERSKTQEWGWNVQLAIPFTPPGSRAVVPLVVAGMSVQRPGQSLRESIDTVLRSACETGAGPEFALHSPRDERTAPVRRHAIPVSSAIQIPAPPRSQDDQDDRRRAEQIRGQALRAGVLGELHRKSRGFAYTQVDLAIHLAAMNDLRIVARQRELDPAARRCRRAFASHTTHTVNPTQPN